MRIAKIEKNSVANGPGIRVVIWCQGCSLNCEGCHNKEAQDPEKGRIINPDDICDIYYELEKPWVRGVTFSGGHPLEAHNIDGCMDIMKSLKSNFPEKDIWLYTGFVWEDIKHLEILNYVDVVVDGPYIQAQRNIMLPYRGSENQRVIDVKRSLNGEGVVLYEAS